MSFRERSHIVIGSRKSQLALIQTEWVKSELSNIFKNYTFEIKTMDTQGDIVLDVSLSKIGDKGLFTKELEDMMLNGTIDFAVHSLKDIPTVLPNGLKLASITKRHATPDAFIVNTKKYSKDTQLSQLPEGALIGSSSLRRIAQLKKHYPHLKFRDIRGNLNTRFKKLEDDKSEYDGMILAVAGLERMNLMDKISQIIPKEISMYAVGQGSLGIECAQDDLFIQSLLEKLNHYDSAQCCIAERSMLRYLQGGCHVPIGVDSNLNDKLLKLEGIVLNLDGSKSIQSSVVGSVEDAENLGITLAKQLIELGADKILQENSSATK
ncbi:porphobilinogen deaminase [Tieghemostelium lacteum]|uniref:Porphobilinogen deaminase n=1 Tax=Tieghemostelium lacteum TaxID=361077 RepID=A0A151ZS70_TIELA|nr:porphobilinogen deaminase [Tieghemostelium lacteum]|eukprot:KYQ96871.1 porphobilinogen deaminase [Tieghemostelium lacteum]